MSCLFESICSWENDFLHVTENLKFVLERVENIREKEKYWLPALIFLLFPQKAFSSESLNVGTVWWRANFMVYNIICLVKSESSDTNHNNIVLTDFIYLLLDINFYFIT